MQNGTFAATNPQMISENTQYCLMGRDRGIASHATNTVNMSLLRRKQAKDAILRFEEKTQDLRCHDKSVKTTDLTAKMTKYAKMAVFPSVAS